MSEQDARLGGPTAGKAPEEAPLIDPSGQHYWDGQTWQPLPTRRHAGTKRSQVPTSPRRRRLLTAVAIVAALAMVAGGAAFWQVRSSTQAGGHDPKREAAYRDGLEHMYKNNPQPLSEKQFADALVFGYDACAKFEAGMSYEELLTMYGPNSKDHASQGTSVDALLDETAEGVAQILLVAGSLSAASTYLCPDARAADAN
jgi:hypothetical protein